MIPRAGKAVVFLVAWLCAVTMCIGGQSEFARHAPANTILALYSADLVKTCAAFQDTGLGKIVCGADFVPLIEELRRTGHAAPLHLQPALGFDWSDLAKTTDPGGLIVFPLGDRVVGTVWLFAPAKVSKDMPPCLQQGERYFRARGFGAATTRKFGATLTLLQTSDASDKRETRVLFVADTYYGVANSQAAADAVLSVAADRSLAARWTSEDGASAPAGETSAAGDVYWFLRPFELWKQAREANGQTAATDRDPVASSQRLGLDAVQIVTGRIRFGAPATCDWSLQAEASIARPYRKALRLIELRPGAPLELPPWSSAQMASAWLWRWDFPLAMQGYGNLYDEANEPGPDGEGLFDDMLNALRDDPEGVRVDLRGEVFQSMGADVTRIEEDAAPGSPNAERWVYAMTVRDMPKVLNALTRFYRDDKRVEHTRIGDYDVWTVGEGASLFVEGESKSLVTVRSLALGRGQLLFSSDASLLNGVLSQRAAGASLAEVAPWNRLIEQLKAWDSPDTVARGLFRLDRSLLAEYPKITDVERDDGDNLLSNLWHLLLFATVKPTSDLPYAKLPPAERLGDALPPAALSMSQSSQGLTIRVGAMRAVEKSE